MSAFILSCCEYPEDFLKVNTELNSRVGLEVVNPEYETSTAVSLDLVNVDLLINKLTTWKKENNYD